MATNGDNTYDPQRDAEEYQRWLAAQQQMPRTGAPATPAAGTMPTIQPSRLHQALEAREEQLSRELNPPPAKTGWGKFGRVMGTIGQDIGTAIFPRQMEAIPGTTAHRERELGEVTGALQREQLRETGQAEAAQRAGLEQERIDIEKRKAGLPTLVPGPEYAQHITNAKGEEIGVGFPYATPSETPGGLPNIKYAYPGGGGPPAPAAAGGEMPKVTYGTPKQPTATADEDKYLAALSVPPEKRSKDEQDIVDRGAIRFQKQTPIGEDGVKRYGDMAQRAVAGTNITPPTFDPKESTASADEKMKNLQTNVTPVKTLNREQSMLQAREDEKDKRTQVLSVDPNDGQLKLTTRFNAIHSWADPDPQTVTGAQLAAMRNELPRLNDVQMNFSNYVKAYRDQRVPLEHPDAVKRIMSGVSEEDARAMSYLTLAAFSNAMQQGEVSNSWNKLNKGELDLVSGYLRSKGSLVAYNYTVSGTARGAASPTVLAIDVATLPTPDVGAKVALPRLQTFQENLDVLSSKYPTNLTGIKTPRTYKEKIEGTQQLPPGATEYVPKR